MTINVQRFIDNFRFVFQPRRKPKLLKQIGSSYLKYLTARTFQDRPLRNVDIALSYSCNLTCSHCSCESMKKNAPRLNEKELMRVANEAQNLGSIYFSFTGGEPLINDDLEDIIQLFQPEKNLIGLQTNATMLDERRLKSLYKAGVDVFQVSVDSSDAEEHDTFRGMSGAHTKTMRNIDMALGRGFGVILCTTISHENIRKKSLVRLLEYSKRRSLPIVVSIACPVGRWAGNESIMLNDEDRKILHKLQKRFPHLRRDFESNYMKRGCSACVEKLYITPYGDVIPCPFVHISFGNIRKESLASIRDRMLQIDYFTRYNPVCLAGEDKDFINTYISKTFGHEALPINWSECLNLKN